MLTGLPLPRNTLLSQIPRRSPTEETCFNWGHLWGDPFCLGNLGMSAQIPKMWPHIPIVPVYEGDEEEIE